jgi:hypothetical protein
MTRQLVPCSLMFNLFGGWLKWKKQSWTSSCDYRADGKVSSSFSETIQSLLLAICTFKHLTTIQPVRFFCFILWGGVGLRTHGMLATDWPIVSVPDDKWVRTIRWNCRRKRSTQRKPVPVPICPPQIPHDLTWDRNQSSAMGNWLLTTRAMAWQTSELPIHLHNQHIMYSYLLYVVHFWSVGHEYSAFVQMKLLLLFLLLILVMLVVFLSVFKVMS